MTSVAFDFAAADAAYASPSYLRTPLREFLLTHDRGIYWLKAPEGLGKTLFVRGIIARRPGRDPAVLEGIDSAIAADIRAVGLHLKEDGIADAATLSTALSEAATATLGAAPAAPVLAGPGDLLAYLEALRDAAIAQGAKRLMLCLDGIEAAPGLVGLLPALSQMPQGVVLLLTSRPDGEFAAEAVAAQLGEGIAVRAATFADKDYVDMLRKYFVDKLRPLERARAAGHLQHLLETKATFEKGGRDSRLTNDPVLRDGLKDDWKKLTNKYPRYTGLPLPITPIVHVLDTFDKLWTDVMDRSGARFGLLAPLVLGLADGSLAVEEMEKLPAPAA